MKYATPGDRVRQLRKHLNLTQSAFSEEIGMTPGNLSKIEKNQISMSKAFLKALKLRFFCNPDWIETGEGEMFISPEEHIADGIRYLGIQKYGEGLLKVLNDPQFAELRSMITIGEKATGKIDPELMSYLCYILNKWQQGDEDIRGWLRVQLNSQKRGTE